MGFSFTGTSIKTDKYTNRLYIKPIQGGLIRFFLGGGLLEQRLCNVKGIGGRMSVCFKVEWLSMQMTV